MKSLILGVLWNLFLAVVPIMLGLAIYRIARRPKLSLPMKTLVAILGFLWLVFLPNTCYLLTEWRHFLVTLDASNLYLQSQASRDQMIRLMVYTCFYFCYSAAGMISFALALRPVVKIIDKNKGNKWLLGMVLFPLLSVGVYLGLILRFNSWDIWSRPNEILSSLQMIAARPLLATFILLFAIFLWLSYIAIDMWFDGLLLRWKILSQKYRA